MSHSQPRQKFLLWGHIEALCDTETDGGGWIVIQRRVTGDVYFYRGWNDYKNGFGTPDTDFWIGNDVIHNLTSQGYTELRIDLKYGEREYFAHYFNFNLANELRNYRLTVGAYAGTAGDSLNYHNGVSFATYDKDNSINCAAYWHGAGWYVDCHHCNLNGVWGAHGSSGVIWYDISDSISASFTEMKVRQV